MMKKVFLLTCVTLLLSLHQELVAQNKAPLFPQAPGMQTYTFRFSMKKDVAAVLDTIKSLGISVVESSTNPEGMSPEAFRKLLDERGLSCPSVGIGYDELVKDPAGLAKKALVVGAKYVMCAWIPHTGQFNLENARKAVEDYNRAGKILKENGLTLCHHTHGFEFVPYQNGTLFDYIVKNTDPRYVSFEMDIMWTFHGGQDPAKLLLKYPNRWKLMHLKDLRKGVKGDLTGGTPVTNDVALGTGQLDIPSILKAAKKVGVKYYFIEDESPTYKQQIPVTMAYLKGL
jgi:sugar phosphate isomerase/epimerase